MLFIPSNKDHFYFSLELPPPISNVFWFVVVLPPAFNTFAKGLAPLNCNRSAEPLAGSFCFTGAVDGVGSGMPNKSRILGVAFEAVETGGSLFPADENGFANGFDVFCAS
jgi:hypothetical protein